MAEHVRLLQCLDCKTLEELPDYQGDPRGDHLLEVMVQGHKFPSGTEHRGHLHRVEKKHWDSPTTRATIEAQIREKSGHTGLDPNFYAAKNTFQEDAMSCWKAHQRNPGCSDYKTASKQLTPGTAAERKAAGLPKYRSAQDRFLCEFCPVHSLVVQAARKKAGLYN
ncbi:hypothetical protein PV336_16130 [Streptomyces sp. MI02-2A]|uniref:hypothetical protein n=1 Tax=Streptomyces sp. MI02-2A TaxID=3028688 RepID=UPI0029B4B883|nr:hypothetical protein [Streptomyces sp. MI02-2A]MDX3260749.1 hypothetical protein [Streptomyces sp. MI02-2A]